jgi:dCMP deaminase
VFSVNPGESSVERSEGGDVSELKLKRVRPEKVEHYFNRAKVAAERSTCLRRKIGAVIIKNDVEVSSGYVGSPRGTDNCTDGDTCLRIELGIPSGERYELCRSVHAEQNAIINAARVGIDILDGEMYIWSEKIKDAYSPDRGSSKIYGPCMICKKMLINAGLKKVHMNEKGVGTQSYTLKDIRDMLAEEEANLKKE